MSAKEKMSDLLELLDFTSQIYHGFYHPLRGTSDDSESDTESSDEDEH